MADFTVADVLAWARTKPADETYYFTDARNCAVAQFGRETGREYLIGIGSLRNDYPELDLAANPDSRFIPMGAVGFTFGQMVRRLEFLSGESARTISDTWTKADAYLTDIEPVEA